MAQDSAMLVVACSCGQKMKVPAEALGKTVTCVKCGERLRIALDTADPDPVPAAAPRAGASNSPATPDSPVPLSPATEPEALRLLRQHGLLNDRALEESALLQKDFPRTQWDLLIDVGHLSALDFHTVMAKQKGIASIDLMNYHIPREVLDIVPPEMAYRGMFIPVDRLGKLLTLAMACPLDTEIIAEVEKHTNLKVKRMLSTVDDVRRMLDACYPQHSRLMFIEESGVNTVYREFESALASNPVARRITEIDHFPPFIQTAEEVHTAADSGDGSALRSIADMVSLDPVSTALILRVSNSDAYGFSQRVDGLGLACTLLGPAGIARVVRLEEAKNYATVKDGFDYEGLWLRARFCAEAAQAIAMRINPQTAITAYTAALIHDLGRLALRHAAPNSYPLLTKGLSPGFRAEAEQRLFHLTAPEAGYMLARKWSLPMNVAEAIRFHRTPERAKNARELTHTVALAAMMADAFEAETSLNLDRAELFYAPLNLSRADTVEAFQEARAALTPAATA